MAREIVITSVPRGVKLGRTGFQVAMQTAGMREDLAAALEKLAGYRHLGAGMNPVCYFHRIARTVAGQVNVIGRTVDAGVDFSNRSNKLAHMVVVDAAEVGQVMQSSPAAALAAVEPRLASVWTAAPEERQTAFSLAGIPPSQAAPCAGWQQVMGDAGWAGVIAERALQNQPTLIVGTDPSPASCRRMLGLFQEALALVPPNRRWGITFDTTTLSADGVLWRGTYAGSPESQATHPGLLVVDLARPQPIPATMAAGDLVQAARTGQVPMAPVAPTAPSGPRGPGVVIPAGKRQPSVGAPTGPIQPLAVPMAPTAPPRAYDDDVTPAAPEQKRWSGGLIASAIAAGVLVMLGLVGGGVYVAVNRGGPSDSVRDVAERDGKTARDRERERKERERREHERRSQQQQQQGRDNPGAGQTVTEPQGEDQSQKGGDTEEQNAGQTNPMPTPPQPPQEKPPTPDEAFAELQNQIAAFKGDKDKKLVWPPDPETGLKLFPLDQKFVDVLDATPVVGKMPDFPVSLQVDQQAARKWNFKVNYNDSSCTLATLEFTKGNCVLRKGDAPEGAWTKYEKFLRIAPIGFVQPSQDPSKESLISVSPELALPPGATLHDLLCGDGKPLALPGPANAVIEEMSFKAGKMAAEDSPVQLDIVAGDDGKAHLVFTARSGDRDCTLTEPIEITGDPKAIQRNRGSWQDRQLRLARFPKGALSPKDIQLEKNALGLGAKKDADPAIADPKTNVPKIVYLMLRDTPGFEKTSQNEAKGLLEEWTGYADNKSQYDQVYNTYKSLEDWRACLQKYVKDPSGKFKTWVFQNLKKKNPDLPDGDPGNPGPEPKADDKEHGSWEKKRAQKTAYDEALKQVDADVTDPDALRQFLESQPPAVAKEKVDPELAAAYVLLEFDGFILVKSHREEVEALLNRVPVAALVEGQAKLTWAVEKVSVEVPVRLLPADVLEQPAAAASDKPDDEPAPKSKAGGEGGEGK